MTSYRGATLMAVLVGALVIMPAHARADDSGGSFLGRFHTIRTLASTVPANGDLNPYG